ncbi:MAG: anaerobic sulfatase maturase [Opitutae bacterium]
MSKPTGAICNLDCNYCFFLEKELLYPGSSFRMSESTLETYISQLIESQATNLLTIVWQGGEPTMMGIGFFQKVFKVVEKYRPPRMQISHAIQTNGTLLNDEWCELFARENVLVGLSMDGPAKFHDKYRVDKGGQPTHSRVMKGLNLLKRHGVQFNILCTVNAANQDFPLVVYRYFRDELDVKFIQFIPIVEILNSDTAQVTNRSVNPNQWGKFLITIFDEWVKADVGEIFVQMFDVALGSWMNLPSSLCIFSEVCGNGLALEHNGDLFSCDHFVNKENFLGNINEKHMLDMVSSEKQISFGRNKKTGLTDKCRNCPVKFACNGECPKNRIIKIENEENLHNYLCEGYLNFFTHIDPAMKKMRDLLHEGRFADEIMN